MDQQQSVIPEHFFDVCLHQDQVLPAYGAVFEYWDCNTNSWVFVACGKDMSPPKEELGEIEVSPTCNPATATDNSLIYSEYIPSRRVEVETFEIELDFRREQFFRFYNMFRNRQMALWRIVATNPSQTFFLWKGFVKSTHPDFPADAEATAKATLTVRPSGLTFKGDLVPAAL